MKHTKSCCISICMNDASIIEIFSHRIRFITALFNLTKFQLQDSQELLFFSLPCMWNQDKAIQNLSFQYFYLSILFQLVATSKFRCIFFLHTISNSGKHDWHDNVFFPPLEGYHLYASMKNIFMAKVSHDFNFMLPWNIHQIPFVLTPHTYISLMRAFDGWKTEVEIVWQKTHT